MLPAARSLCDRLRLLECAVQVVGHEAPDFLDENVLILVHPKKVRGVPLARRDGEALYDHEASFRTPMAFTIRARTSPISRRVLSNSPITSGVSGSAPILARWASWFRLLA